MVCSYYVGKGIALEPVVLFVNGFKGADGGMEFLDPPTTARLEGFSKNLEETSLDLGVNAWMTYWRVTFPLILPAVGVSLVVSDTAAFDAFLVAFFPKGNQITWLRRMGGNQTKIVAG